MRSSLSSIVVAVIPEAGETEPIRARGGWTRAGFVTHLGGMAAQGLVLAAVFMPAPHFL